MRQTRMIGRASGIIVAAALFLALSGPVRADGTSDCANIQTDKGKVTGVLDEKNGVCGYKGIPYVSAPVGELRFARPVEHEPWPETLIANDPKAECLQMPMSLMPAKNPTGSEDCLYLNIWHPKNAAERAKAVMVFLHGGSYIYGSKNWDLYDGANLSRRGDVVVVTINYRLSALGFLVHPALKDKDGYSGNYGLWDQLAALKWVKKNIARFGGDPDNVTLFGESAGGISVGLQLVSPESKGLFHKAIIESGPMILFSDTVDKMEKSGTAIAELLGCKDPNTAAECLRSVPAERFIKDVPININPISDYDPNLKFTYEPCIDGRFIPDVPLKLIVKGLFATGIPVIIGSNSDEASYFTVSMNLKTEEDLVKNFEKNSVILNEMLGIDINPDIVMKVYPLEKYKNPRDAYNAVVRDVAFTCPTDMVAKMISKYQPNTFLYIFAKPPTKGGMLGDWGAFHGSELAFVYGNFEFMGIKFFSKANAAYAKKVIAYWADFAKTGTPKPEGLPEWTRFNPQIGNHLLFGEDNISMSENYQKEACDLMESYLSKLK